MYTVRPARPEEMPWVIATSLETAWEQVEPGARPHCDRRALAAFTQGQMQGALRLPGSVVLLAEAAGETAGYITVAVAPHPWSGQPVGFLLDIWVAPARRGQGVADALCSAAEAHCRGLGLRETVRTVAAHNAASLRHAQKSGCRITHHLLSREL